MFNQKKVKAPETQNSRADKVLGMRVAQVWATITVAFFLPMTANAAISDWIVNIGDEFKLAIPIIVTIMGLMGVTLAGFGIISAIMAKKNQRPLEFQLWFVVGGVLLVLLIPFVVAMGESVSGQNAQGAIDGIL